MFSGYSRDYLEKHVGYFDDNLNEKKDFKKLLSFEQEFLEKLGDCRNKTIINIFGCFSPPHKGHREALVLAKKLLEQELHRNVIAIVSLAHDSYVSIKRGGTCKCEIDTRIKLTEELFVNDDWVFLDNFPAKGMVGECNFPFLIDRLEKLKQIKGAINTACVIGGDNAGFALAIRESETYSVEVVRENKPSNLCDFTINSNQYAHYSSSKIRNGLLSSR